LDPSLTQSHFENLWYKERESQADTFPRSPLKQKRIHRFQSFSKAERGTARCPGTSLIPKHRYGGWEHRPQKVARGGTRCNGRKRETTGPPSTHLRGKISLPWTKKVALGRARSKKEERVKNKKKGPD